MFLCEAVVVRCTPILWPGSPVGFCVVRCTPILWPGSPVGFCVVVRCTPILWPGGPVGICVLCAAHPSVFRVPVGYRYNGSSGCARRGNCSAILSKFLLERKSASVFSFVGIHLVWISMSLCAANRVMLRSGSMESPRTECLRSPLETMVLSVWMISLQWAKCAPHLWRARSTVCISR